MNKCIKFTFTEAEKGVSTSYLTMLKWLFKGFNMEEVESLKTQISNFLEDELINEYEDEFPQFKRGETNWLELLGVLADKFDDLIFETTHGDDVELSMSPNKDK